MINVKDKIVSFTNLDAWRKSHEVVLEVYKITKKFPKDEQFGLISQMRRAAVSITSNIAEGFSRSTYQDKAHFYIMAHGSLTELQNQLLIARDVNYLEKEKFNQIAEYSTISHKLITGLIKSTKGKIHAS